MQLYNGSLERALLICARYPVTSPPRASRAGGLQVTLMELQPPVNFDCKIGGYGTSVKRKVNKIIHNHKRIMEMNNTERKKEN